MQSLTEHGWRNIGHWQHEGALGAVRLFFKTKIQRIRLPSSCRTLVPSCRSLTATSDRPLAANADLRRAIWPLAARMDDVGHQYHQYHLGRSNARDDLPALASRFGADLLSVPQEWLDMEKAVVRLQKHGLRLPVVGGKLREFNPGQRIMFWEVYSGCGTATRAFVESASGDHEIAGPPVDTVRKASFWVTLLQCIAPHPYTSPCG